MSNVILHIHFNIYTTLNEKNLYLIVVLFDHVSDWLNQQLLIALMTVIVNVLAYILHSWHQGATLHTECHVVVVLTCLDQQWHLCVYQCFSTETQT